MGIWLLVPEHLRLGTWDLLQGWSAMDGAEAAPRLGIRPETGPFDSVRPESVCKSFRIYARCLYVS